MYYCDQNFIENLFDTTVKVYFRYPFFLYDSTWLKLYEYFLDYRIWFYKCEPNRLEGI